MPSLPPIQEPLAEYCDLQQAVYWTAHNIRPTTPEWRSAQPQPLYNTEEDLEHRRALYRAALSGTLTIYGRRCRNADANPEMSDAERAIASCVAYFVGPLEPIPQAVLSSATFDGIDWADAGLTYREEPWDDEERWTSLQVNVSELVALNSLKPSHPPASAYPQAPRMGMADRVYHELATGTPWSMDNAYDEVSRLYPDSSPAEREAVAKILVYEGRGFTKSKSATKKS